MEQDLLFLFEKCPGALPLYHALEERLRKAVPGMAVKVGKSQASFYLRHQFGCASLLAAKRKKDRPDPYLTVTFGLAYPVESPHIAVKTEPYPNRWTHHILLTTPKEVDAELLDWTEEAYQFALIK